MKINELKGDDMVNCNIILQEAIEKGDFLNSLNYISIYILIRSFGRKKYDTFKDIRDLKKVGLQNSPLLVDSVFKFMEVTNNLNSIHFS